MTCRAPRLAELLAVAHGDVPPDAAECSAPAEYAATLPEQDGIQLTATVCHAHAHVVASQIDGTRLVKRRS